ncbi:MAG: hypothetical protein ACRENB_01520 [Gemmatimonadales bacterium]
MSLIADPRTRARFDLGAVTAPVPPMDGLLAELGDALEASGARYCQWKGHTRRDRWVTAAGDLDLLVHRADAAAFGSALERLGFKLAMAGPALLLPGVVSYLGHDPALERLVHVHAHYRLVLGSPWRWHYLLPIESEVLEASVPRAPFRAPSPAHALLLFVLNQTLRHEVADLWRREPAWLRAIEPELHLLESATDRRQVRRELERLLPQVEPGLFDRCLESLRPEQPPGARLAARAALERRLRALRRRPSPAAFPARLAARARRHGLRGGWRWIPGKRLASGGAVIALVGADGAGKSSCAAALVQWLGAELRTRHAHLGRPPRRLATLLAGASLKLARRIDRVRGALTPSALTAHLELLRHVCTARDRYLLARGVRRFAAEGGLAVCERYPVPESHALAGPSAAQGLGLAATSRLAGRLRQAEASYYAGIGAPDLVLVLRVDADTAVRRKTNEPPDYVHARATLLEDVEWSGPSTRIVDAVRPFRDVLEDLRDQIWRAL